MNNFFTREHDSSLGIIKELKIWGFNFLCLNAELRAGEKWSVRCGGSRGVCVRVEDCDAARKAAAGCKVAFN